jgi:hypothetical protein
MPNIIASRDCWSIPRNDAASMKAELPKFAIARGKRSRHGFLLSTTSDLSTGLALNLCS